MRPWITSEQLCHITIANFSRLTAIIWIGYPLISVYMHLKDNMMLIPCMITAIWHFFCSFIHPSWRTSGNERDEWRKARAAVCQRRWESSMILCRRFAQVKSLTRTRNLNVTASALSTSWWMEAVVKDQSPRWTIDPSEYSQKETRLPIFTDWRGTLLKCCTLPYIFNFAQTSNKWQAQRWTGSL